MTDGNSSSEQRSTRQTKVERLIDEYDLDGIGAEFERRWTAESGERDSLRTLAATFNRRLLERRMRDNGMDPIAGEVENIYRLLTDEEVSRGMRTEVTAKLDQHGIDVESLRKDFVTYQAIRTYLTDVRGATYESESGDGIAHARSSFDRLVGRMTAVVEQKLEQLQSTEALTLGSFRVRATVTIYCEDCETQYPVTALLDAGSCDCEENDR